MPSDEQLKQLLALVEREHPRLIERNPNAYIVAISPTSSRRAFYGVGSMPRLSEPTQKVVFSTHVDRLNNLLRRRGHPEVDGDVVLAALIAWAIPFRLQDLQFGMVAEAARIVHRAAAFSGRVAGGS